MRSLHLAYVLALAAVTGLGSAHALIGAHSPVGRVSLGAWDIWPRAGAPDADPYTRAVFSRRTHLPLGIGEGLAAVATRDESGQALDSACDYVISGLVPPSRGWTLALDRPGETLRAGLGERTTFTDAELTRDEAGRFTIRLSRSVRPGDWLPLPDIGRFQLTLRLYDTPVSGTAGELRPHDLPSLRRERCR